MLDSAVEGELANDRTVNAINFLINELKEKHNVDSDTILRLLSSQQENDPEDTVPLCILAERPLGILEAVTKFLRENKEMSFNQIAKELNRDNRTIWSAYHVAKKKNDATLVIRSKTIRVPLRVFSERDIGLLESISVYLRDKKHMGFSEIGRLLNRSERTIWSSYHAAKRKRGGQDRR